MYVSVRHYTTTSAEEVIRKANESFRPIISALSGFHAYYVFDSGNGTATSVSVFDTQAQAEESNRKAAEWVKKTIPTLITGAPQIIAGYGS
jgi:hypothetical protein